MMKEGRRGVNKMTDGPGRDSNRGPRGSQPLGSQMHATSEGDGIAAIPCPLVAYVSDVIGLYVNVSFVRAFITEIW